MEREQISQETINNHFPARIFWIKSYAEMKKSELKKKINKEEFNKILDSQNCENMVMKEQIVSLAKCFINKVNYRALSPGVKQTIFSFLTFRDLITSINKLN